MLSASTKKHIDDARDVLVGVAPNPTTQIDQITYALIYKFMDDMDQAAIQAGGEPSFFTGDLASFSWKHLISPKLGNQEKMGIYVEALEKFSTSPQLPELFRDIFKTATLPYRSSETLGLFLKEINHFDYSHPEELGNAYEYLLSIMSSQGDAGQFRTPRNIIDFIVNIVDPAKHERILDPSCGTAGFLVSSYNHILEKQTKVENKALTPDERKTLTQNLEGFDIDPTMVRIAQVNMYLHQFKTPHIFQYDSLTSEERWSEKYDVILANPPFMTPKGGIRPHTKFSVQTKRSEVLFIDYIVNHLRPDGRAGIVVPETIIFQQGKSYSQIRKLLIESGLFAVVGLPSGVFLPYSTVKTCILFLDKTLTAKVKSIAFYAVENDGYDLSPSRKPIQANDLPQLQKELIDFTKGKSPATSKLLQVNKQDILADDNFYLTAERYVQETSSDQGVRFVSIGEILEPAENGRVGEKDVPVMSITMANGLVDQSDKFKKRIASESISDYKLVKRNDLVVGFPIDEGVLGFLKKYEEAAVSPAYGIWKLKPDVQLTVEYLERVLRSEAMREVYRSKMQGAIGRRRNIPKDVFLQIQIPHPSGPSQKHIEEQAAKILSLKEELEETEKSLQESVRSLWNAET